MNNYLQTAEMNLINSRVQTPNSLAGRIRPPGLEFDTFDTKFRETSDV